MLLKSATVTGTSTFDPAQAETSGMLVIGALSGKKDTEPAK